MIVVDTNVVAYLLIEGAHTAGARALRLADPEWCSEPFLMVEFSNLLATQVRSKALNPGEATTLLATAAEQLSRWIDVPHAEALTTALRRGVSAYDARFLAAALRLNVPLVTEDARLRAAAGDMALSIAEALAASGR
jgi:predicted nucleic acid-binding protein